MEKTYLNSTCGVQPICGGFSSFFLLHISQKQELIMLVFLIIGASFTNKRRVIVVIKSLPVF